MSDELPGRVPLPEFRDGERVKVTLIGVYRKPGPDWKPFVTVNDGTTIDADRWAVQIERLDP